MRQPPAGETTRELLTRAQEQLGARSLYALAQMLGLDPRDVQRWYQRNRLTRTARRLIETTLQQAA